jgi:hypothetical protein
VFAQCYQTCLFEYNKTFSRRYQAFLITNLVQICTSCIQIRRLLWDCFAEGVLILTNFGLHRWKCGARFKILNFSSQIPSPFPEQSSLIRSPNLLIYIDLITAGIIDVDENNKFGWKNEITAYTLRCLESHMRSTARGRNNHFYFDLRSYPRSLLKNWSKIISRSHCSSMILDQIRTYLFSREHGVLRRL